METPKSPTSINHRIREGLGRLAVVLRSDDWERAKVSGLNPTQLSILDLLEGRPAGLGIQAIARQLVLSQPTVTDSVKALERKGLVDKRAGTDRRAVSIILTAAGRAALTTGDDAETSMARAVDVLGREEQEALLLALVRVIRQLQEIDAIPVQRMCSTCRYFDPFIHADADRPHHCHYVNASFGQRDIRIDCREHETADPASQAATWDVFTKG
jgi:DNA-binding MarR family transcriptional regulator